MSAPDKSCRCAWCASPYTPRRDGGKAQRFCGPDCRAAFHRALRQWAIGQLELGAVSLADLKAAPAT
jgi:hypothetical protein